MLRREVHDLRRTVATGLQRLGVRLEITEAVLNHISGSRGGIAGVYQRHDWAAEKRAALDAWAAHVLAEQRCKSPERQCPVLRITDMTADMAKPTRLTLSGPRGSKFAVMHNKPCFQSRPRFVHATE
jgi:hypothetical protein